MNSWFRYSALFLMLICRNGFAAIQLPALINDNMVLQQQSKIRLWGTAAPGASVVIRLGWDQKRYRVPADRSGNWECWVQTPAGGFTAYDIKISDGKEITVKNVLLGEVWLCGGQ